MSKPEQDNIFYVRVANWKEDIEALRMIRTSVFIEEQNVPVDLEWDELDKKCTHFIVHAGNKPVATARLSPDGQIGRMSVLQQYRKKGIGTALILNIISYAKESGFDKIWLHAQTQVISFYEMHDFKAEGSEFMDAGIKHKTMNKNLN